MLRSAFAVVFSAVAACGGGAPMPPGTPTGPERIAFAAKRGGSFDVYVMNVDGTGVRRLTSGRADEWPTSWSPDGTAVAFVRERGDRGSGDLHVVQVDDGRERRVTDGRLRISGADWSPDGSRFAMTTEDGHGWRIETIKVDGSDRRPLTAGRFDFDPTWSPDGRRLLFVHIEGESHDRHLELYVVDADGDGRTRLTRNAFLDAEPDWSPAGDRVAFVSNRAPSAACLGHDCTGSTTELYTMTPAGTALTRLTRHLADDRTPTWSTGGGKLVFARDELYAMNPNGGCETRLTNDAAWKFAPAIGGTDSGPLRCADVAVVVSAGARYARVGRRVTFAVGVQNIGTLAAPMTTVVVDVPDSAVLRAGSTSQGRCTDTRRLTCTLGVLPPGARVAIRIDLRPRAGGRLVLEGTARTTEHDPNRRNRAARAGTLVCSLLGSARNDRLTGTAGDDVICGRGGDDVIDGRGGTDVVYGDDGDDVILGGAGGDVLRGGPGDDRIVGGAGRDWIDGGTGCDTIHSRDGQPDRVRGDAGRTTVDQDAKNVARERGAVIVDRACRPRRG